MNGEHPLHASKCPGWILITSAKEISAHQRDLGIEEYVEPSIPCSN
jgi:hypothetical protein